MALRILDVIENYSPDFIYTDGNSTQPSAATPPAPATSATRWNASSPIITTARWSANGQLDTLAVVKFHGGGSHRNNV